MAENVRGQNRNSPKSNTQSLERVRSNSSSESTSLRNHNAGDRSAGGGRDASRGGFYPRRNIRIDDFDGQLSDE